MHATTRQMITTISVATAPKALIQATSFMDLTKMKGMATMTQEMMLQGKTPISPAVPLHSSFKLDPDRTMYKMGAPSKIQALKKKVTQPPTVPKHVVAISLYVDRRRLPLAYRHLTSSVPV